MIIKVDESVHEFVQNLEKPTISKVSRLIDLLKKFGHQLSMPYSKKLSSHLYELRIRGSQEVRIFYTFHQDRAILFHCFVKKTQKTPRREIETALVKLNTLTNT